MTKTFTMAFTIAMAGGLGCSKAGSKPGGEPAAAGSATAGSAAAGSAAGSATAPQAAPKPAFDEQLLEQVAATADATAKKGQATVADVIAQVRAKLGAPTLIAPSNGLDASSWALVTGDSCAQLDVVTLDKRAGVDFAKRTVSIDTPEDAAECADAAHGVDQGRRFAGASHSFPMGQTDEAATVASVEPLIGKPTVRATKGKAVRLVWARPASGRCDFAIATIEDGAVDVRHGAASTGMPWFAECSDWAAGKPTGVWADDVEDAAHFAALTAPSNPNRVDAADALIHHPYETASSLLEPAEQKAMLVKALGKPRFALGDVLGWAVADRTRCAQLLWFPNDSDGTIRQLHEAGTAEEAACAALAAGDPRPTLIESVAANMHFADAHAAQAWLRAQLGAPTHEEAADGGGKRLTWAIASGGACFAVELLDDGEGLPTGGGYVRSDSDYDWCVQRTAPAHGA